MIDLYAIAQPLLGRLPPEAAHRATIAALRLGLVPAAVADDPLLALKLWGKSFPNPIGMAAGFDKNAEVPDALLRLGFGFVEVGTVTPRPQPGNPKPRIFRLAEDEAVINRLGFNSEGMAAARVRLARRARSGVVGVNLGANRESSDPAADYVAGLRELGPLADYVAINVSSPNTPGLRDLQERERLRDLVSRLMTARAALTPRPPLLLKIAPDLGPAQLEDIVEVALSGQIDGLIVSNTTVARPDALKSRFRDEKGGLSGAPLFQPSTDLLRAAYRLVRGRIPLVGVGGVRSGEDAYAKIRAGASLVQLYTALVYRGAGLVTRIKRDLLALMRRDGFGGIVEAVGADSR